MNPFELTNKNILVTGASSGIGRSIAVQLAAAGACVAVVGRNETELKNTFDSLSGSGHTAIATDLTDNAALATLMDSLPALDGIVHAAGMIKRFPLKFTSSQAFHELLDINVVAASELTRWAVKKRKLNAESSVVFISSVGSDYASLGNIMYMATKGAVNSLVKGLALELAKKGIRVNAVQPGLIVTHLTQQISSEELALQVQNYPLGRFGTPEEVAFACQYLLSDTTKWMTGSFVKLDGGLTLR